MKLSDKRFDFFPGIQDHTRIQVSLATCRNRPDDCSRSQRWRRWAHCSHIWTVIWARGPSVRLTSVSGPSFRDSLPNMHGLGLPCRSQIWRQCDSFACSQIWRQYDSFACRSHGLDCILQSRGGRSTQRNSLHVGGPLKANESIVSHGYWKYFF